MNGAQPGERFRLSSNAARSLAQRFGTPLFVLSERVISNRIAQYQSALGSHYAHSRVTYASKANGNLRLLAFVHRQGCGIDVASAGEFAAALAAEVSPGDCTLHGNFKKREELQAAIQGGVGKIVVDSFVEMRTLAELAKSIAIPPLLLRINPNVEPKTHEKITTAAPDSKFGVRIDSGDAEECVRFAAEAGLPLVGYHCHVGSQLIDISPHLSACREIARFGLKMETEHHVPFQILDIGGGLGVRYLETDQPISIEAFVRAISEELRAAIGHRASLPMLVVEPGRSIVAEAGVTLYEVGPMKEGIRQNGAHVMLVSVDGGLSDNPRPAMYGGVYEVAVEPDVDTMEAAVVGRHCETDILIETALVPRGIAPGDIIQVLSTGAYSESMASNYNRFPRPATVWLDANETPLLAARRETVEDLLAREQWAYHQEVA